MAPAPGMPRARLNYVELAVKDTARSKAFYEAAFGWQLVDFAPSYAATVTGDTDIGLDSDKVGVPLPVIDVPDLEAAQSQLEQAGGRVIDPITPFPGGRRFLFTDPDGNLLAVVEAD